MTQFLDQCLILFLKKINENQHKLNLKIKTNIGLNGLEKEY